MADVKIEIGIPNTYYVIFVHKNNLTNLAFFRNKSDMYSYSILFDLDYNYAWWTYDNFVLFLKELSEWISWCFIIFNHDVPA